MSYPWAVYPCACSFAKNVGETDPCQFPRVGMADNVLYRGHWIIEHKPTGKQALIVRQGEPPLHAEAAACCFDYFNDKEPEN